MVQRSNGPPGHREFEFRCGRCGAIHRGSPSFAYDRPIACYDVPEEEWSKRVYLTSDLCVIDNEQFYIRTLLAIPINDATEPFGWGVWVSQSEASFARYVETFGQDQSGLGSFGWLGVTMPAYLRTKPGEPIEFLQCDLEWGVQGMRPLVRLRACDHPLFVDQRDGIDWKRAVEIAEAMMHSSA